MAGGSSRGSLVLQDTIEVLTQGGNCKIEYYLGDICKLKAKNKVDVLLVSAFRDNYEPEPSSLIGALKSSLGLSVKELAQSKAEDLRTYYSCWVSQVLPKHLPFNRLVCFEPNWKASPHPKELVGDIFRCLVPVLQNENGTVITPILTSGKQRFPETDIVHAMIEAAVKWIKVGLPLKCLKIVQYAVFRGGKLASTQLREYEGVKKVFEELKERYDMQYLIPKATRKECDVFISCSEDDAEVSLRIQEELRKVRPEIRIEEGKKQKMMEKESWQDDMYDTMMKSERVITVISPRYLEDAACIEQYNIALCCNRRTHKDLLAPFYAKDVPHLPSYMQLVQFIDCRSQESNDLSEGCKTLALSLSSGPATFYSDAHWRDSNPIEYDVFLSYCHSDTKKANLLVKHLQEKAPTLRIFFDIQEIKQGKAWQRLLYHSIDGSTIFIALVSETYLPSAVCNEEYRLALAKCWSKGDPLQLVVLKIEDIESLPAEYKEVTTVSALADRFPKVAQSFSQDVVTWLHKKYPQGKTKFTFSKTKPDIVFAKDNVVDLDDKACKLRRLHFNEQFPNHRKILLKTMPDRVPNKGPQEGTKCRIAISCHKIDEKYAKYIQLELQSLAPHLKVEMSWSDNKARLSAMETADRIVVCLSPSYLESPEQVEELHVAIFRQRTCPPDSKVLYAIQLHVLPPKPTYFHLIPYVIGLQDELWQELWHGLSEVSLSPRCYTLKVRWQEMAALNLAIEDLIELADKQSQEEEAQMTKPKPVLVNISATLHEIERRCQSLS